MHKRVICDRLLSYISIIITLTFYVFLFQSIATERKSQKHINSTWMKRHISLMNFTLLFGNNGYLIAFIFHIRRHNMLTPSPSRVTLHHTLRTPLHFSPSWNVILLMDDPVTLKMRFPIYCKKFININVINLFKN